MEETGEVGKKPVSNPQRVSRRSIRSGSEVRHGRVYEDQIETPARAVTPESTKSVLFGGSIHEGLQLSPPPSVSHHRSQGSTSGRDTSTSNSNVEDDSTVESRRRQSQRRTRTKDDVTSDASPTSFITKTRKRLGSITTSSQTANKQDSSSGSIGYPSVGTPTTTPTILDNFYARPPSTPRRTVSSDTAAGLTSGPAQSPLFQNTDASKILQLMKTTCGRMHGILFFRQLGTTMWDSGYCAVNVAPGSLVCQKQGEVAATKTLVSDLRGCIVRTHYDSETQSTFISVFLPQSGHGVQLRPPVPETFDSWLAALLCWQPLRPKGLHSKMAKAQPNAIIDRRPVSQRRMSDLNSSKSTAIVKVGRMVLLDGPLPAGSQRHLSRRTADIDTLQEQGPWRRVSCTLHENGTFKLLTEIDAKTICVVRLSQLSRCAIQRLDQSVLDAPFCLAIYPQYTIQNSISRRSQPLVLGLESKAAYEAWFVLLRALTMPELYGPEQPISEMQVGARSAESYANVQMFRIERSLAVKVTEAKLDRQRVNEFARGSQGGKIKHFQVNVNEIDVYADVSFGQDLMARTATKMCSSSAFWAEEFYLPDVPSMLSTICLNVKVGNPAEREWTMIAHHEYDLSSADPNGLSGMNGLEIASHDPDFGKVEIIVDELEREKAVEKWWPLLDKNGQHVGQVLMRLNLTEAVVLMESEYEPLSNLLHTFENSLTTQIGQVLSLELKQLSEVLLDVFQASNSVHDWICALIDEEIDGIYKDTPPIRMRFSGRIHSNDSYESAEQREQLVRDLSRSATMEANLLFRGNSLVTKALDAHMRRLGKAYLEETIGDKLQQIMLRNPECEVDPMRIQSRELLSRNWSNLITWTKNIWNSIALSAPKCPTPLRMIFKHIRSCAEDRYGSFIRTVKYTSVSGFLFLRFFCPAILNPKLFGLINGKPSPEPYYGANLRPDTPPDRARRTFTLIAKVLNVLASMSKFGTKEPWMEPMNKFLVSATPDFKRFIEEVCSVSTSQSSSNMEPQHLAPAQIRARLPPLSREGLPSLPYLLDAPRSLATLVDLWVSHAPSNISEAGIEDSVRAFHQACLYLRHRGKNSIISAEPAEKPDSNQEPQWQQMLSNTQQQKRATPSGTAFHDSFGGLSLDQDITALPQRFDSRQGDMRQPNSGGATTPPSSILMYDQQRLPCNSLQPGMTPIMTRSTNSSTLSFDNSDEVARNRPLPASRDGSSKSRFLGLVNPNARKRARGTNEARRTPMEHEKNEI